MFIRVSAIAVAVAIGVMNPAQAASTLDQDIAFSTSDCNTEVYSGAGIGQTFTAGLSGPLTSVEVFLVDVDGKSGTEPGLTVALASTSSGLPVGVALAASTIPDSDVPSVPGVVTVTFSSPATVTAGEQYAILITTSETYSNYKWCGDGADTYSGGTSLDDSPEDRNWRQTAYKDMSLRTYVDVPAAPSNGSGSQSVAPQSVNVDIGLDTGEIPAPWSGETTIGSWLSLPATSEVSGTGDNAGKRFLGVATSEDFPVDIAQRQIDNRWGVYEIYGDDGSLKSVFIPAGYSMHITAAPRVFAIWSNAAAPAVGGQVPE
jgi:hypothetical protein